MSRSWVGALLLVLAATTSCALAWKDQEISVVRSGPTTGP